MLQLEDLRLSHNSLAGNVPPTLGKLEALRSISLDHNSIGGAIPEEIGLLSKRLRSLKLQSNRLNGLLPLFFKQPEFRTVDIDLSENPFW